MCNYDSILNFLDSNKVYTKIDYKEQSVSVIDFFTN